ncbi:MAG: ABC transporter permease [Gemmatimonadota bacterium]
METLLHDLRCAIRSLKKSPGFTAVAVLTLALGIGATSALFSVVNGVLLKSLPYPEAERIVRLWQVDEDGGRMNFSFPNYEDVRAQSHTFESTARVSPMGMTGVIGGGGPVRVTTARVSRQFLEVFGIHPIGGRAFTPEEQREGGPPAALVSHDFWRRHLDSTADLSAETLIFDNRVYAVVGVMPPAFDVPAGNAIWTPIELEAPTPSRTAHNHQVFGRLRDGVTLEQARRDLSAIARRLKNLHGDDTWMAGAAVTTLHEGIVGEVRPVLLILLGAAGVLLLIACANVTNLLLARAASREREQAVRLALGAGRGRLIRASMAESLVLAFAGGAIGVAVAIVGVGVLVSMSPEDLPRLDEIGVNWIVLAFTMGVSLLAAILIGPASALKAMRADLRGSLAEGGRAQAGGVSRDRARGKTSGATTMSLNLPWPEGEGGMADRAGLHRLLTARLAAIPGVEHVGGVNAFPLTGDGANGAFLILEPSDEITSFEDFGRLANDPVRTGYAEFRVASEGYFRALGIPLLRGRLFDERDGPDAPHVAVISRTLAETRWPDEDPIGKVIQFGNMDGDLRPFTIVGIMGDVRGRSLESEPGPVFYGSAGQRGTGDFTYAISGAASSASVIPAARRIVRDLFPEAAPSFRTLEERFSAALAGRRFSLMLLGAFGATALLLALMGIYGVGTFFVATRVREIGIRMALGADGRRVVGLVVRQGMMVAAAGLIVGLLAALLLVRVLASLLYGVVATDPVTFILVALILSSVALLASYVPARRAVRVDPMTSLRAE